MDLQDFKYNYKYKIIIPAMYILNWLAMFVGPFTFQVLYQKICICILIYISIKSLILLIISIINFTKATAILNRAEALKKQQHEGILTTHFHPEILHAFIIPNYKEDEQMLAQTMDKIAEHEGAKQRYMVFLGMEGHEENSDLKAQRLVNQFRGKFLLVGYTRHLLRQYEQRGKASNVSWCVQHLEQQFFNKAGITPQKVLLTIIDADSWVPEIYIRQIDDHLSQPKHLTQRERYIYQSNQIFTRNHLDVPILTRVYDQIHGSMHSNNTFSIFDVTFPLSNYSLHFSLAKRIGFWDTCPDAIGQDFHMTEKAFWKTHGWVIAVPILAPMNQVNIQTGKGYLADMKARFWQAERHARGVSDVPYNINMLIKQPWSWKTFIAGAQVMENYTMPAFIPWCLLAMTYQYNWLFKFENHSPFLISQQYFNPLYTWNSIATIGAYFFYYLIKRRATPLLYGLQNESILYIWEYPALVFLLFSIVSIPTYVISAFGALVEGREYVVAEKVITKDHAK